MVWIFWLYVVPTVVLWVQTYREARGNPWFPWPDAYRTIFTPVINLLICTVFVAVTVLEKIQNIFRR